MYQIVLLILALISSCTMNRDISVIGGKEYDIAAITRITDDDIPEACRDKLYCTQKPRNFPDEYFEALANEPCLDPSPTPARSPYYFSGVARSDVDDDFQDDCAANVTYEVLYALRWGPNVNWQFTYYQVNKRDVKIKFVQCVDTHATCFDGAEMEGNVKTQCQQEYAEWEFSVFNATLGGGIQFLTARIPVCCSCAYSVQ